MKARPRLALIVIILLAAAALRSYRLTDLPPGIEHDEVAEWQIARSILGGHHALFFREAYGQEPAYLYLQTISIALLGDNVFALRFTSFAVAMLTLAACYRITRRWFGSTAALVSLALIAVTLWPLFFARVAIRGMTLPFVMCLGLANLKSQISNSKTPPWQWATTGAWLGLAAYTYLAARAIPIMLAGFALYLSVSAREQMRGKWAGFALMLVIAALIAAPITLYVSLNPDVQFRVTEVAEPLKQLQRGDPSGVLAGVRDTLLMFSVRGDETVRDNWPDRPVFADPFSAILFYLGLVVALWRWRKIEYALTLIWLIALLTPAMVTAAPPNFVRTLGALPPIFALPGIGAATLIDKARLLRRKGAENTKKIFKSVSENSLRPPSSAASTRAGDGAREASSLQTVSKILCGLGVSAMIILSLSLTLRDYFIRWPAHPETQFVWQTDLAAVARYLDSTRDVPTDVAIAGLSNETMDNGSLRLLMQRDDLRVRWFDSRATLILPSNSGRIFIPAIVPLDPALREKLIRWGAQVHDEPSGRFTWFDLAAIRITGIQTAAASPTGEPIRLPCPLDNGLVFLAFESPDRAKPGSDVAVLTHWQTAAPPLPSLKAFVHVTDANGKLIAQSDGLNAPAQFWHAGDVLIQLHRLKLPPGIAPGNYYLKAGLYDAHTGARAQFKATGDHLVLGEIAINDQ